MHPAVHEALDGDDLLGEGPAWDDRTGTLSWVDIKRRVLHTWSPSSGARTARTFPEELSLALPRSRGGWTVAQVDTVCIDDDRGLTPLCAIEADRTHVRLNDGCCDDLGDLWIGTYSTRGRPEAALHRVTPTGSTTLVVDSMVASNGVGWSPDGVTLYVTDTGRGRVDAYARDDSGGGLELVGNVASFDGGSGRPDGLAVDGEGGVWVAVWGGARVHRYTPEGRLSDRIELPVTFPTSVCFGTDSLDTVFVTTSRHHLPPPATEPLAGSLLAFEAGVAGLPTRRFGG